MPPLTSEPDPPHPLQEPPCTLPIPPGFVGLGGQGAPMAQALAGSSYELHVLARPAGARS